MHSQVHGLDEFHRQLTPQPSHHYVLCHDICLEAIRLMNHKYTINRQLSNHQRINKLIVVATSDTALLSELTQHRFLD